VSSEAPLDVSEEKAIKEQAEVRQPNCTYCRYNVEHVFKTIEERHAHELTCPNKAAFDRREAATSVIYNKNKNYIEQLRDKKRELMTQYQATNAPTA